MEVSRRSRGLSKSPALELWWAQPGRFCLPVIQDDTLKVKAVTVRLPVLFRHTRSISMSVGKSTWQQKAGGAAGRPTTLTDEEAFALYSWKAILLLLLHIPQLLFSAIYMNITPRHFSLILYHNSTSFITCVTLTSIFKAVCLIRLILTCSAATTQLTASAAVSAWLEQT